MVTESGPFAHWSPEAVSELSKEDFAAHMEAWRKRQKPWHESEWAPVRRIFRQIAKQRFERDYGLGGWQYHDQWED